MRLREAIPCDGSGKITGNYLHPNPPPIYQWRTEDCPGCAKCRPTDELKPCPFCGGKDFEMQADFSKSWVFCRGCGAYGPARDGGIDRDDDDLDFIKAWNRRTG